MSFPEKTTTGYVAIVTPLTNNRPPFVPGMETYYAAYPVVVYESAKLLLEKISNPATACLPRVIVLDLSQSTDTGLSILRRLKADDRLRSIPVLMRRASGVSSTYRTVIPPLRDEKVVQHRLDWKSKLQIAF